MSGHYATAEITLSLSKWSKASRFVFIRETQKPKVIDGQLCFDLETYDYEIIVTSTEELNPEEVWHEYNKRCDFENKIDELKVGLGFEKMSQEEKESHAEVTTIRRKILNVPRNICW